MCRCGRTAAAGTAVAADTPSPKTSERIGAVIPIDQAPSVRPPEATADEIRHDNPHWPVRSPADAADALHLHDECPWHCSTRVAAIIVSRNNYQYFRDRGHIESDSWTSPSDW